MFNFRKITQARFGKSLALVQGLGKPCTFAGSEYPVGMSFRREGLTWHMLWGKRKFQEGQADLFFVGALLEVRGLAECEREVVLFWACR